MGGLHNRGKFNPAHEVDLTRIARWSTATTRCTSRSTSDCRGSSISAVMSATPTSTAWAIRTSASRLAVRSRNSLWPVPAHVAHQIAEKPQLPDIAGMHQGRYLLAQRVEFVRIMLFIHGPQDKTSRRFQSCGKPHQNVHARHDRP